MPHGLGFDALALLLLLAHLLMYRAFMEMLENGRKLWRPQLTLVAAGVVVLALSVIPALSGASLLIRPIWAMQYMLIGWMLVSWKGNGSRIAGWFAASAMFFRAACHLAWFWMVATHVGPLTVARLGRLPGVIMLVSHSAIAFGFLLVAGSRLNLRLEQEARIDELTGLMNRRAMRVAVLQAIARCRRSNQQMSLVMMDLDGLKGVNDRLGHDAGDMVLREVSKSLCDNLRFGDDLARLGGDEFCLLLPAADEAEAVQVAERCRRRLAELELTYHGEKIVISASFGVAHSPDCTLHWEELLRRSDAALYVAKRHGKNRVMLAERPKSASALWVLDAQKVGSSNSFVPPVTSSYREATGSSIRSSAIPTSF
ncbi:GGDEF domain-containing protein [Granulicella arctica]|uniref:diguanylate cyclase n=1 Tax=Granulicella arctica TaxID=940613 RepID=A0A7Y9PH48_9BACT|nr:GGDEF domain-containing protein [Granulicella arctica]NYF79792.1 diguanylate cyclase (GGDEF)-like protein [Granulicella arctica]